MASLSAFLFALAVAAVPAPAPDADARPFSIEFADPGAPEFADDWEVHVDGGVEPGRAIVFVPDAAGKRLVIRPARPGEATAPGLTTWQFEWSGDTAMFYAQPDPARLDELRARNDRDIATKQGADYEVAVSAQLLQDGQFIERCFPETGTNFRLYLRLDAQGKLVESAASPPGRASRCLQGIARAQHFARPPRAFVAIIAVRVTP